MNIQKISEIAFKHLPVFEDLNLRIKQTVCITLAGKTNEPEPILLLGDNEAAVNQAQAITQKMLESDPFESNCIVCLEGISRNLVTDGVSIIIAVISHDPDESNRAMNFWLDTFAKELSF